MIQTANYGCSCVDGKEVGPHAEEESGVLGVPETGTESRVVPDIRPF